MLLYNCQMDLIADTNIFLAVALDEPGIAQAYTVGLETVVRWFNRWERLGMVGLQDGLRSGRPEKLTPEEQRRVQHRR